MCGIAGLIAKQPLSVDAVRSMTDSLRHRGPDDEGQWRSDDGRMLMGQRRLSIIDLSPTGHQPMHSSCGRFVMVYNGEIYNYAEMRQQLETSGKAPIWRGTSDSEVFLAAIEAWGLEATLRAAMGMFAIALWDKKDRALYLARDRFGEKPLYYGMVAAGMAFASELKAIRALPGFVGHLDSASVRHMLGLGYVAPDQSIYQGIKPLAPGAIVRISDTGEAGPETPYYDYTATVLAGADDPITDAHEAMTALEQVLTKAVSRQMVADVPVGAFLSGGVDSSLITALAARTASHKIKSFSIGFTEDGYDEAPYAKAVAAHLGTDHQEHYVSAAQAQAVIPLLPTLYDEPFGDSSQIPTFLVCQFAKQHVTVALSGDAGDELFGGYNRHSAFPNVWRRASMLPAPLRRLALGSGGAFPPAFWNWLFALGGNHKRPKAFGHKIRRTLQVAAQARDMNDLYRYFLDEWYGLPSPIAGAQSEFIGPALMPHACTLAPQAQIMLGDALNYLPGDILTKVDRAAMGNSLEGRIPFLDPDVAALAARIPESMKFSGNSGKMILRELLYTMVPRDLIDRPKAGFAIPVGDWLKGPLRDWAENLLSVSALSEDGLLAPEPIRARWQRHLTGQEDATQSLWSVLMLQAWRQKN